MGSVSRTDVAATVCGYFGLVEGQNVGDLDTVVGKTFNGVEEGHVVDIGRRTPERKNEVEAILGRARESLGW